MAHANDSAVVDTLDTVTRPCRPQDSVTSLFSVVDRRCVKTCA